MPPVRSFMRHFDRIPPRAGPRAAAQMLALCGGLAAGVAAAQPNAAAAGAPLQLAASDDPTLLDKSLAELMAIEVVSASRHRVALSDTGAAVFVITQEDIVRSGARVLPEVLRLAPGVDVARLSSGRWAIGVRGDTSRFSGGLQVLLDGRSIYSPYFSSVFWDVEQVPLADIERIEIVRGPAGAIWGPNAVNGVINILTFSARDTLGTRAETLLASDGQRWLHLRHGAATPRDGDPYDGAWRLSARASGTSSYRSADGRDAHDENQNLNLTGRLDQRLAHGDLGLQLQALQSSDQDEWVLPSTRAPAFHDAAGVKLKFRRLMASSVLTHRLAEQNRLQLQASIAQEQAELSGVLNTRNTTTELQLQQQLSPAGSRHALTYGAGVRGYFDHTESGRYGGLLPADREWSEFRLFAHDRITLAPVRLWLTTRLLLDHNRYTGWQPQPSIDLAWRLSPLQSLWGSLAHSSRVPGRSFQDAQFSLFNQPVLLPGTSEPQPVSVTTRSLQPLSTQVTALQLGSRWRFGERLSLDLTAFTQRHRDLGRFEVPYPAAAANAAAANAPLYVDWIGTSARSSGLELAADWRIRPGLRSQLALSTLHVSSAQRPELEPSTLARSPHALASWRLSWDLAPRVYLDGWLRYSASRPAFRPGELPVRARTALDLNLRWRASPLLTLSLGGYNLGAGRRLEASNLNGFVLTTPVLIEPAVALRASIRY